MHKMKFYNFYDMIPSTVSCMIFKHLYTGRNLHENSRLDVLVVCPNWEHVKYKDKT